MSDTDYVNSSHVIIQENQINFSYKKEPYKKYIAELVGTFIFIFISLSTVNSTVLSAGINNNGISQLIIALGFGFGLMAGVALVGPISDAHLNPSISFSFWVFGKLSILDLFWYIIAQTVGAFLAALLTFIIYYNLINELPYDATTSSMFGTLKKNQTSLFIGIIEQIIGSALLMFGVLRVVKYGKYVPLLIGIVLFTLGICLGNNGFAFNPARDMGPRIMTAIMGWGFDVFNYENHWFLITLFFPFIGAPIGFYLSTLIDKLEE